MLGAGVLGPGGGQQSKTGDILAVIELLVEMARGQGEQLNRAVLSDRTDVKRAGVVGNEIGGRVMWQRESENP